MCRGRTGTATRKYAHAQVHARLLELVCVRALSSTKAISNIGDVGACTHMHVCVGAPSSRKVAARSTMPLTAVICQCAYINAYVCAGMHACVHAFVQACMHALRCACLNTVCTHLLASVCALTSVQVHVCVHACLCMHTQTVPARKNPAPTS